MPDNIKEKKEMENEVPEESAADNDTQLEEMEKVEEGKVKEMAVQEKMIEVVRVEVVGEGLTGVPNGKAPIVIKITDTPTTEGELKRKLDLQNETTIEKEIPLKKLKSDKDGDSGEEINPNSAPKEDNNKEEEAGEKAEQQDEEMADGQDEEGH